MQDFFLHRDDNIVVPPVFAGNKKTPASSGIGERKAIEDV